MSPFALRPFAERDLALYAALFADAEVMHAVGVPFDRPRAERAAATSLRHQASPDGRFRHWVVEHAEGAAGLLGLALRSDGWADGEAELGVLLWPAWRARGAATSAIRAVLPWAFEGAGLRALACHHAEGHAQAAALMQRVGFRACPPAAGATLPCGWRLESADAAPQAMEAPLG